MTTPLIHNRANAGLLKDFSVLRIGTGYPTDINGFLDLGGEKFVWIEVKFGGADCRFEPARRD
jgi:hypothetical protein